MHIIPPVDAVFILTVGAMALFTHIRSPKKYKPKAWFLFAEFCTFVGLVMCLSHQGLYDGMWFNFIMSLANLAFAIGFVIVGSRYLSRISSIISLYFIALCVCDMLGVNYLGWHYGIMISLSILQLCGLLEGIYHGLKRKQRNSDSERRHNSRYFYSN